MKLLTTPHPTGPRLIVPTDTGFTALVVVWVAGIEWLGHRLASDVQDAAAVAALAAVVLAVVTRHRRRPLPWVARGLGWATGFVARLSQLKYDHGIDLRGSPPIRRKVPPVAWAAALGLLGWGAVAGAGWAFAPGGWRDLAAGTFYLGYLAGLAVVWAGLLTCVLVGAYVPLFVLEGWLKGIAREADRRGVELALVAGYLTGLAAVAALIPPAVVLIGCLGLVLAAAALGARTGRGEPAVLWRAGPGRPVYAVPLHRLVAGVSGLLALLVFDLLLISCGGRLLGGKDLPESMPLTTVLGAVAAWLTPGAAALAVAKLVAGLRSDPARRQPPTLHVRGADPAAVRDAVAVARRWGWRTATAPTTVRTGDVTVEVVAPALSEATDFEPRWPLRVSLADLADDRVKGRLARRDEIQLRRRVFHGVASIFKRAAADRGRRGGGYWFAPHWWFIDALGREEPTRGKDDESLRPVGPAFADVFGPRPRQHLHVVLRAVAVDMVFIEDGVDRKAIDRVLRALFELYDVHGGKRKAEDHHFRGVPKVRVMVHEYAPGKKFRAAPGYKEPGFDDLSRARVLHVFKDRGGQEEEVDVPFDSSWEPAPAMGVG